MGRRGVAGWDGQKYDRGLWIELEPIVMGFWGRKPSGWEAWILFWGPLRSLAVDLTQRNYLSALFDIAMLGLDVTIVGGLARKFLVKAGVEIFARETAKVAEKEVIGTVLEQASKVGKGTEVMEEKLLEAGGGGGRIPAFGEAQVLRGFTTADIARATSRAAALEESASSGSWLARIQRGAYYEAGSKTWPNAVFREQFLRIKDPVVKGILTVERYGRIRSLTPELTKAYVRTIGTGLTPLARDPRVLLPVGGAVFAGGIWAGLKIRHWFEDDR